MTQIEQDTADFNAILQALDTCSASIGEVIASAPERGTLCTQAQAYAYSLADHVSIWRSRVQADCDIMVANAAQASQTPQPEETPQ